MMYKASVTLNGQIQIITSEYNSKKDFAADLRRNGYKVQFVATPETFEAESDKYNERRERKNSIARYTRAAEKESAARIARAAATEETNEEPQQEDKHMKKRFFYLADIGSTFTVTPMTKKEIISIGQELKELCAFISDDQTISGYTKEGRFFYYDNSNFDSFKKSDIINAVSVIYSDESGDYYYGGFDINEWGVAGPTEDGSTIIADHDNIKEVENADYSETAEEPAADQEPEENENYIAWCGMIENDVITEEYETLSEAIDEVETRYTKEEMKAAGVTFCRLLCNENSWLECLDEKTVDDVYYF